MEPNVETTPTLLNDKAFTFLERFMCDDLPDTLLLFNVKIELAIVGITFKVEEWIDLINIIILNPKGIGINAIKAVWELTQTKVVPVVPLLEDAAAWQLVLCWASHDSLSFANFLTEMEKFGNRYQFDKWKPTFDQVFEASWEGTAVEVVRAAMAEHGIVEPSYDIPSVILSPPSSFITDLQKLTQIPPLSMPSKASKNEQVHFPISGYFCVGGQRGQRGR
ncbi:hypothetical protein F5J12DRAFT_787257 [Pisolithus orientalis]|uniref:uncharacterized protein n=1 Tax=Pisolithus orientalis TaxID=936130 RepID=UPI00222550F8|nr:uncharacterized protein F5J12DRAFT_787257 [Pisolithus orientalis]KAI5986267.1 hypothetical protein F5J12DRAFT_787257 [Pisolithus orientalis]